ncbi:MAG: UDP-N-acetylglucosamine pyrophosphorylase [Clostridia bacterium]|nr:UDP-N-acetylglucosamine pyrophosphorylase [Clostridia bacterium]
MDTKKLNALRVKSLLNTEESIAKDFLDRFEFPWDLITHIGDEIIRIGKTLSKEKYDYIDDNIWISKTAKVAPSAFINGPCIIDDNAEIRHCAFIRGNAIVGRNSVVGNSTELKNVILFNSVQVPHFNYVGDSILGYKAHMGAGAITSNVKSDKTSISLTIGDDKLDLGLYKFGAVLGDFVEIGCNSVLNPGTIVGRNSAIYPVTMARGYVPENSICKETKNIVKKDKIK